jgi:mRNA interferase RelE/StbE
VKEPAKKLAQNPRPPGAIKLAGGDELRLRVGDYRIIYVIDDAARTVTVVFAGHRRDVYLEWDR